jgi:hypothetical protein
MTVKRGHDRQLLLFWYHGHGDTVMAEGVQQNLLRFRRRLVGDRDDGSLVRLSIGIDAGGDHAAEHELSQFAAEVIRLLPEYWPLETRVRS